MPRINEEDDVPYELVIREKRQDVSTVKSILQTLFSSVGLVFLCGAIAVFGKYIYQNFQFSLLTKIIMKLFNSNNINFL